MFEESKEKNQSFEELHIDQPAQRVSGMSVFFDRVHSLNTLHLVSALSQVFLGTFVLAITILGVIQPVWVSTIVSILASVTSVIGLFFLYNIFTEADTFNTLLHKAIKRVINSQN